MTPARREQLGYRALKGALLLIVVYLGYMDFNLPSTGHREVLDLAHTFTWVGLWLLGLVASLVLLSRQEGIALLDRLPERFAVAALILFPLQHVFVESAAHPGARAFANWMLVSLALTGVLGALRKRALESERHRRLAEANGERALRARLAPHFIFNTLNTLQAQIALDPVAARASTFKLAKLFRQVLSIQEKERIPLSEELDFVQAYLDLEQLRFGPRLRVEQVLPPAALDLLVPPLCLQILVENALKHGVAPLEAGGLVRISAQEQDDFWTLWVEDPGPGAAAQTVGTGTALETLRGQLRAGECLELGRVEGTHRAKLVVRVSSSA